MGLARDRVFMQRCGLPFLSHAGLAIVLSISYQVSSPGLVQSICGIFNLGVGGVPAPDSFCHFGKLFQLLTLRAPRRSSGGNVLQEGRGFDISSSKVEVIPILPVALSRPYSEHVWVG